MGSRARIRRLLAPVIVASALAALAPAQSARGADLPDYLVTPDDTYGYDVAATLPVPGGQVHMLRLTSQTWHGIPWRHWLRVIVPNEVKHPDEALLVISGGRVRNEPPDKVSGEDLMLAEAASRVGSVVAVLGQVPNQPLFEGLSEDALIAFTFQKYVDTKDETWPCLLPMVRSAVRAMDAVQSFTADKRGHKVSRFFVTGASKRGWTTWLAAAADKRVMGIAPMVIDVLNMRVQMAHQVKSFGTYSEKIGDYTRLGLPQRISEPDAQRLLELVDPYSFRDRITVPKLIVLGTNDPYWPVDALKNYFPDLVGEKYIHYVPNAGHGLGPSAVEAVSAFYQSLLAGERRPRFAWRLERDAGDAVLTVEAEDAPKAVELWTASQPSGRDFRRQEWSFVPVEGKEGRFVARVPVPAEGFKALYASLTYTSSLGHDYKLCTNVEVVGRPPRRWL